MTSCRLPETPATTKGVIDLNNMLNSAENNAKVKQKRLLFKKNNTT